MEITRLRIPVRYNRDFAFSISAPHVKIVPLIDVHQLLMLFAGTLTYSEPKTFSVIIFYNMLLLLLSIHIFKYEKLSINTNKKLLFIVLFNFQRYIKTQNNQYWSSQHTHLTDIISLHSGEVGIWCSVIVRGIVVNMFINKTINCERYLR
jgi:type IV secretory pathway VirB3-like protein